MRVDLYGHSDESYTLTDAIIWQGLLVVGWGHRLYLVDLKTHKVQGHRLGSYFGHLYTHENVLLVASAEQLFRMEPDGSIAWTTKRLGIDGVLVERIENGIVEGEGEWDAPGGWRPFRIHLNSGQPT